MESSRRTDAAKGRLDNSAVGAAEDAALLVIRLARRIRHLVVVDEAWLLRDRIGADRLFKLATDLGRAIVSNAAIQLLLRQAPRAID